MISISQMMFQENHANLLNIRKELLVRPGILKIISNLYIAKYHFQYNQVQLSISIFAKDHIFTFKHIQ